MALISVLFVCKNSSYNDIQGLDLWEESRDAKQYYGLNPVVCHPPCARWCKMTFAIYALQNQSKFLPGNDDGCFQCALINVNRCGGVMEHPACSFAWKVFNLTKPKKGRWIECGKGFVCEVWQSAYGHKAKKPTWLYYRGIQPPFELRWEYNLGTHQVAGNNKNAKNSKPRLSKYERVATPDEFRDELIQLAAHSRGWKIRIETKNRRIESSKHVDNASSDGCQRVNTVA